MFNDAAREIGFLVQRENSLIKEIERQGRIVRDVYDALWRSHDSYLEDIMHLAGYCLRNEANVMPSGDAECPVCILCGVSGSNTVDLAIAHRENERRARARANALTTLFKLRDDLAGVRAQIAGDLGE